MTTITNLKRIQTSYANTIQRLDTDADLRAAVEYTESLIRDLERQKRELRAKAIDAGLAIHKVALREGAPTKARYIELHGRESFELNKNISSVRTFVWVD
jgi:hypothetical protein